MELTKPMLKSRKPRMISGPGEAWFYISPAGLEFCVAEEKGRASSNCFLITVKQMETALEVIRAAK